MDPFASVACGSPPLNHRSLPVAGLGRARQKRERSRSPLYQRVSTETVQVNRTAASDLCAARAFRRTHQILAEESPLSSMESRYLVECRAVTPGAARNTW